VYNSVPTLAELSEKWGFWLQFGKFAEFPSDFAEKTEFLVILQNFFLCPIFSQFL